jgi:hypothetical protein
VPSITTLQRSFEILELPDVMDKIASAFKLEGSG